MPIVKSVAPAYGGYSLVKDDKVILIKGAIPGEVVDISIEEKKKDYSIGKVVSVVEPSDDRRDPSCPLFGICGGCHLQYISYERQLAMKDEILADSLLRLGKIEIPIGPALCDASWNYRHKAQFKVSREGEIGFFRELSRDVVSVGSCPLMTGKINEILAKIRSNGLAENLGEIHIAAGDTPVVLLKGSGYDRSLFERLIEIGLSGIAFNDSTAYGGAYTSFDLNGLRYTLSPWTFFQAHWSLNRRVVEEVVNAMLPLEGKQVLDLYAGAGNFSLPAANNGAEVVAVEENPLAVEDGMRNAELNGIKKFKVVKSSAEKFKITKKYDILILDPPRPGLASDVTKKILDNPASRIIYISCNPSTLARDLKKLKDKYDIISVRQIDFFPQTFHIEALAILQLR